MTNYIADVRGTLKANPIRVVSTLVVIFVGALLLAAILIPLMQAIFGYRIMRDFTFVVFLSSLAGMGYLLRNYLAGRVGRLPWQKDRVDAENPDMAPASASSAPTQVTSPRPSHRRYEPVRALLKGTRLIRQDGNEAVMQVKAAIRFWAWALPLGFLICAFSIGPTVGAWVGANAGYGFNAAQNATTGGVLGFVLCVVGIFVSYIMTRPEVTVRVDPESISFGPRTYDRKHHRGLRWSSPCFVDTL